MANNSRQFDRSAYRVEYRLLSLRPSCDIPEFVRKGRTWYFKKIFGRQSGFTDTVSIKTSISHCKKNPLKECYMKFNLKVNLLEAHLWIKKMQPVKDFSYSVPWRRGHSKMPHFCVFPPPDKRIFKNSKQSSITVLKTRKKRWNTNIYCLALTCWNSTKIWSSGFQIQYINYHDRGRKQLEPNL